MSAITKTQSLLENLLGEHLRVLYGPKAPIELAEYAVLPAGKLFRPLLALAAHADFSGTELSLELKPSDDLALLASFLEIHHAYTLVHDDMPAMDDDDTRRGRPSHHVKFGQWRALLTGDALAIGSFHLLAKMKSPRAIEILKIATWATGPKGLIQGQYKDLSHEMNENLGELLETHLLKTARLIQLAMTMPLILEGANTLELKTKWRFGRAVGILFQLLDDLCELGDEKLSQHERDINPWLRYGGEVEARTLNYLNWIITHKDSFGDNTKLVLQGYFKKILGLLNEGEDNIIAHTERPLTPVVSALGLVCTL